MRSGGDRLIQTDSKTFIHPMFFFSFFFLYPCDLSVVVLRLTIKRMVPACSYAQCVFNDRQCLRHSRAVGSLVANRATLH
jgi:hypothetical protein